MKALGIILIVSGLLLTYAMAFTTATADGTGSPGGADAAGAGHVNDTWHGYVGLGMLLVGCVVLDKGREPS